VKLLAKAKDDHGRILIPGIYDDVATPDPVEVESWKQLPFSDEEFLRHIGASALTGEPDQSVLARIWARPTFEVHGIAGGFTGTGAKTVIPARAVAKVSLRLVPNQDPRKVLAAVKDWVATNTPEGIQTEVRVLSGANPGLLVNPHHPAIDAAAKAFSETLGKPTVFVRGGGSIPIVGDFARELGIPTVLMGFGLPDDGLHSPNEKFRIANYYLGIRTVAKFMEDYGAM
jgi:acetylornithine deacetylase/succinyl-diaminopimelate desuccinylase-like protein